MLIDKGLIAGETITLKLTSGEELIGKLIEENTAYIKILKPMVLSAGSQGLGMFPYLFTVDPEKDVKINKNTIVVIETTGKQFADAYVQQTTGIKLV